MAMEDFLRGGLMFGPGAIIALVFTVGASLFWMYLGWRAMRAHERLASAAEAWSRRSI